MSEQTHGFGDGFTPDVLSSATTDHQAKGVESLAQGPGVVQMGVGASRFSLIF